MTECAIRYVYFLQPVDGGPIKIGCSASPEGRLKQLTQWSPYPLQMLVKVPAGKVAEVYLHRRFAADLVHGEWFRPSIELMKLILTARSTGTIEGAPEYVDRVRPYDPNMEIHNDLGPLMQQHGFSFSELAEFCGVKHAATASMWSVCGDIPAHRVLQVVDFFRSRGVQITEHDLQRTEPKAAA